VLSREMNPFFAGKKKNGEKNPHWVEAVYVAL
jgi:hypothetical protein